MFHTLISTQKAHTKVQVTAQECQALNCTEIFSWASAMNMLPTCGRKEELRTCKGNMRRALCLMKPLM